MRRLLVAAISVGEGIRWASNTPICTPAVEGDVDPEAVEYAGRLRQLQAVTHRVDALSKHNSQALTTPFSTEHLPEQWCCAVIENSHLTSCCRQIMAGLKRLWGSSCVTSRF